MPSIFNKEVTSYKVDIFQSTTLNYDRSLRLELADPYQTVYIEFPSSAPNDNINIGSGSSTVRVNSHRFDEMYHLLQTENPVYFTAYEFNNLRFVGLTTDPEGTGEGFQDPNA